MALEGFAAGVTVNAASAVLYLTSEAGALVTAAVLRVDGGWTAQ
jgi:hypothetical protein